MGNDYKREVESKAVVRKCTYIPPDPETKTKWLLFLSWTHRVDTRLPNTKRKRAPVKTDPSTWFDPAVCSLGDRCRTETLSSK